MGFVQATRLSCILTEQGTPHQPLLQNSLPHTALLASSILKTFTSASGTDFAMLLLTPPQFPIYSLAKVRAGGGVVVVVFQLQLPTPICFYLRYVARVRR